MFSHFLEIDILMKINLSTFIEFTEVLLQCLLAEGS